MDNLNTSALKKGVEVGQRTGQKVAIRVSNLCTQFVNALSLPKCDALRLLQRSEYDLDRLIKTRKDLAAEQLSMLQKLKISISAVVGSKAVLEQKVGELAQTLDSSIKGFEARMLDLEHVAAELTTTTELFSKTYFEARYGDYIFSPATRINLESFSFRPCVTRDFMDLDELVERAEFEELAQRVRQDITSLEVDFERLPPELRDDRACGAAVETAIMAYKNRYFESLNRETGMYALSRLSERLKLEKEDREKEMACDALDEEIETVASLTSSQPLEEYDILEDEIYICNGISQTTSGDGDTTDTTATTEPGAEPTV